MPKIIINGKEKVILSQEKKVNKKISFSYGIAHGNFDKNEIYNERNASFNFS